MDHPLVGLVKIQKLLKDILGTVDESHNVDHALRVCQHVLKAVDNANEFNADQVKCMMYAALLHDTDDHKYCPNHKNNENGRFILDKIQCTEQEIEIILEIINSISFSKGQKASEDIEKMACVVRDSDRLEAIGEIGWERCVSYSKFIGNPMHVTETPRASSLEEIFEIAKNSQYNGKSASVIDHCYEKLLNIEPTSSNVYFSSKFADERNIIAKKVLEYWKINE